MNPMALATFIAGWAQTEQALAPLVGTLFPGSSPAAPDLNSATLTSVASLLGELGTSGSMAARGVGSAYAVSLASRLAGQKQPATLIGWSMGGMVALETAIHFPELVGRLVLISSCAVFRPPSTDQHDLPTLPVRAMVVGLLSWQASRLLQEGIRASDLLLVDGGNHGLIATSPQLLAPAIVRFFERGPLAV